MLEAISVNLTTEEMVVLLDQLGVDGYAGLNTSALDGLSDKERGVALDVARRGLIARRALVKNDANGWSLGQYPLAALGASLSPERTAMVLRGNSRDTTEARLFHVAQDVFTTHEVIDEGIHRFLILRDGDTWREAILSSAGLDLEVAPNRMPALPPAQIHASALNDAYEQAQSNSAVGAAAVLAGAGVESTLAKYLATTLAQPVSFATVIAISHGPALRRQDVTLLAGASGCWQLEPGDGQEGDRVFSVIPITVERARERVGQLLA